MRLLDSRDPEISTLVLSSIAKITRMSRTRAIKALPLLVKVVEKMSREGAIKYHTYDYYTVVINLIGELSNNHFNTIKPAVQYLKLILQPPIYNPDGFAPGLEKVYTSVARTYGKIGLVNPTYLQDAIPIICQCYIDTFTHKRLLEDAQMSRTGFRWSLLEDINISGKFNPGFIIPNLLQGLSIKNDQLRISILSILSNLGTGIDQLMPSLAKGLENPDDKVRIDTLEIIEAYAVARPETKPHTVPYIIKALNDRSEKVKQQADLTLRRLNVDLHSYKRVLKIVQNAQRIADELSKQGKDVSKLTDQINNARLLVSQVEYQRALMAAREAVDTVEKLSGKRIPMSDPGASQSQESQKSSTQEENQADSEPVTMADTTLFELQPPSPASPKEDEWSANLLKFFNFSTFVVYPQNQFTHAAAESLAKNEESSYNPLFIHSGSGLGKTHILHAIGNRATELDPSLKVLYTTAERFTNDLINAIRDNAKEAFQAKFRNVDILLIDDIHFLAGQERTQEEFFHTFNSLLNSGKKIVITCDRPPTELSTLQNRIISRFKGGLITDIKSPEYETRMAILRRKTQRLDVEVPDSVVDLLARNYSDSIRELEGGLNEVVGYSTLTKTPITIEMAHNVLNLPMGGIGAAGTGQGQQPDSMDDDLDMEFTPPAFEWGVTYLSKEDDPGVAYNFYSKLASIHDHLCISRVHPTKLESRYRLPQESVIWLSKSGEPNSQPPTNIGKIAHTINHFIKKSEASVIILDGLEYLISNNDFPVVMRMLDDIQESIVINQSIMIIPISPTVFSKKELTLLERNTSYLTPQVMKEAILEIKSTREEAEKPDDGSGDVKNSDDVGEGYKPNGDLLSDVRDPSDLFALKSQNPDDEDITELKPMEDDPELNPEAIHIRFKELKDRAQSLRDSGELSPRADELLMITEPLLDNRELRRCQEVMNDLEKELGLNQNPKADDEPANPLSPDTAQQPQPMPQPTPPQQDANPENRVPCPHCNQLIMNGSAFCNKCGLRVR